MRSFTRILLLSITLCCSILLGFGQEVYRFKHQNDSVWSNLSTDGSIDVDQKDVIYIQRQLADGTWEHLPFTISREPSWIEEPWAAGLIIFSVLLIITLIFVFLLKRYRKNTLIQAKLAELERSALQAQMNPHFIFNSLNSIQSYIAANENDKANRFLAKFSRLIRAMLNNSRASKISLQEEIDSLRLYLELEKMRFKEKFDFDIVVDDEIIPSELRLPPLLIQPYLENAIIHGLAQKRSQGKINLYYIMDGNHLHVTVTDNGIGIEAAKKRNSGDQSLHKSVGMSITQKRLELLDGSLKNKMVTVKEVKDRKGEVIGTQVDVKIRVQN